MEQADKIESPALTTRQSRRGSNQSGMRAYNERLVLSLIREAGAMAKSDIARGTGLSAQTVSVIMRSLEADHLLVRGAPVRGKIGQPSIPMRLAKTGAFFFGLKVGRRSLDLVLTDFLGTVLHRVRVTHPYPTPKRTVEFVSTAMTDILAQIPQTYHNRIAGLGIALPFELWNWANALGVDQINLADWKDSDIGSQIGTLVDFPVLVCNDASAACGAELVFGDQSKPPDFLYFFVGFFVGGGLVLDGTLCTGRSGNGAALGSLMVPTAGGTMRQLVDVASLAVLERAVIKAGEPDCMNWDAPDNWRIPEAQLEEWLTQAADGMAYAILASVCVIDVNHVIVDGWLPEALRAELVRRVQIKITQSSIAGVQKPQVTEGSIGSDARALGAASLPLSERFLVDRNSYQKGFQT